jgi:phosphopantothenoylcysteine decarboxylase/phosphopantothenate--cysteine ligase
MPRRPLRVVLGVTGSIAAYKAAHIVRGLAKAGHETRCVLTPGGAQFITPMTLAALSRHAVAQSLHDPALWDMAHLSWSSWADAVLVAPATADFIARLAHGRAEGLLDSLVLSAVCPIVVCPAMDAEMWAHAATRRNVAAIKEYGYQVWGPEEGELASGKKGYGRLLEPAEIVKRISKLSPKKA